LKDGSVLGWGAISRTPATAPAHIPGAANVVRIAASGHALAMTSDGRVMSWGPNTSGELGRDPQRSPIEQAGFVEGLQDVVSIATGTQVSLAVKKDGTVWAWGSNGMGQFGNGQRPERSDAGAWTHTLQRVPGVTNAVSVAAAVVGRHVLALLKNGTVMAWGSADWGQTGSGVTGDFQLTPRPARIADVKAVFACGNQSLAIRSDNSLWTWGNGDRGEFPLNAVTKLPVLVTIN
jgi:alpha-tubulin suppressor-like RCC1 family protein